MSHATTSDCTPSTVPLAHAKWTDATVTSRSYRGPVEHYANAARVDPGVCWRFVSRGDGYRKGSPNRLLRAGAVDGSLHDRTEALPGLFV
jgi:hypothetical protein